VYDSVLGDSVLMGNQNEYSWILEHVVGTKIGEGQCILDMDAVNDRLFIIFNDLKLVEVNLQSSSVVREFSLAEADDASE